jgi:mannose-6-phosphate isomerase
MLYPIKFRPILMERVWGGRELQRLYGKALPPDVPIGESWEISDRPGAVSVIANGDLAGRDLRWLMEEHGPEVLGGAAGLNGRFPWLMKILDARDRLSLQVHPPAHIAPSLGGEPKTEMWFVAAADTGACLYVGLKQGVSRELFEDRVRSGGVDGCFHRIPVKAGDAMFLPSGRVHAIGAGMVIFEIQENSDTTYRVFDWNRVGLDGKARALHIAESLASIDFSDFEPSLVPVAFSGEGPIQTVRLVTHPLFRVESCRLAAGARLHLTSGMMQVVAVTTGKVELRSPNHVLPLCAGDFCLVPASVSGVDLEALGPAHVLRTEPGSP